MQEVAMATLSGSPLTSSPPASSRRFEHLFFFSMSVLLTLAAVAGFAKTYFFAGLLRAKLPSPLIHIHGVVFTFWFVVLLCQAGLASAGRVDLHRRLGMAGIGIACLMLPLGFLATAEFLARMAPQPGLLMASVMPITELFSFGVLAAAAFLYRSRPDIHKRLIILATIGIIGAAVGRMEFLPDWHLRGIAELRLFWAYTYVFLVPLAAFDILSLRKLHRATLWGSAFLISLHQLALSICTTGPWRGFARWVQSWGV
jgi:hypothetical protein